MTSSEARQKKATKDNKRQHNEAFRKCKRQQHILNKEIINFFKKSYKSVIE